MLEFLTLVEHAALYLSLPVLCIWSLVRGAPETKFAIWGIMSEYYLANFLKHALHLPDGNAYIVFYSIMVESVTAIVVIKSVKSVFLLIFESCIVLSWLVVVLGKMGIGGSFWSAMATSEFFTWVGHSCFALALVSDDRFPNAHWRDVAKLARFWR
jgi:hypothetical protein